MWGFSKFNEHPHKLIYIIASNIIFKADNDTRVIFVVYINRYIFNTHRYCHIQRKGEANIISRRQSIRLKIKKNYLPYYICTL